MKKQKTDSKIISYILAVLACSFLFYQQKFGVNSLLFTALFLPLIVFTHKKTNYSFRTGFYLVGSILSAIAVTGTNSSLSIISFFVFLLLFLADSFIISSSPLTLLTNSLYSVICAPILTIIKKLIGEPQKQSANTPPSRGNLSVLKATTIGIPFIIFILFSSLYAGSNPAFSNFITFISFEWLSFTLWMALLLFGAMHFYALKTWNNWENKQKSTITRTKKTGTNFHPLGLKYEARMGVILFLSLNVLLTLFHAVDINYLLNGAMDTDQFTYSEYVHQGVYTLIISILLAIGIILYFFRGNLNFYRQKGLVQKLAYAWVIQNIILVAGIVYKNGLYINEYSLTYKRIGVYVYLLLACIGLITTFFKIKKLHSTWRLITTNSWAAITVLLIAGFIPWDIWITQYNLQNSKEVDYDYLYHLSDANIPLLITLQDEEKLPEEHRLNQKIERFRSSYEDQSWLSWNYQDYATAKALKNHE